MNKKVAFVTYVILGIVTAALLVMTVLQSAGITGVFDGMPIVLVFSLFILALAVSIVMFNPHFRVYTFGFYLLHLGMILFLVGGFAYTVGGTQISAAPPNAESITPVIDFQLRQNGDNGRYHTGYYNQIGNSSTGEVINFPFGFKIESFKTEYYKDGDGKDTRDVKHYEAVMSFRESDGSIHRETLTVNHPLYHGGYKIYLMGANLNEPYGFQQVTLLFKRDKTEFLSNAGIFLTVIGTFLMCFGKRPEKHKNGSGTKAGKKTAGRTAKASAQTQKGR